MGLAYRRIIKPTPPPTTNVETKKTIRKISYKDLDFTNLVISNKEDVTLIWLDENINKRDDVLETKLLLQITNYYVLFCADKDTCLRAIDLVKTERIVLILSGKCAVDFLQQVHSYKQIDSIFVFCYKLQRYDCLRHDTYSKLVDICNCHDQLFNKLNQTIKHLRDHLLAFSLFNPKIRVRHLDPTSANFFWFLFLKDALEKFPDDEKSKQDMTECCRYYYRGRTNQLKDIDDFEQNYDPNQSINWYSRPLFVSHLVNKALRTEDFDLLYTFRFFVINLSKNIRALAAKQSSKNREILHLERGLTLSNDEIDQLRSNLGNYMSPNGFMSASRSSDVANIYGTNTIFKIKVDTSLNLCADIQEESVFPIEREVLFDLNSVFRIDGVFYDEERKRTLVELTAESNGEELIANILQSNDTDRPEIYFGELIYLMENYEQADRYFYNLKQEYSKQTFQLINQEEFSMKKMQCQKSITKISNKRLKDSSLVLIKIAEVYQMTGNYTKAIEHLQTILEKLAC